MALNFLERWGLRLFGLTPSKFEKALPAVAAIVADYQAAEGDIKAMLELWNNKIKPVIERNRPRLEDAMAEIDAVMPAVHEALELVGANHTAGKPLPQAVTSVQHALKNATPGTTTKWLQQTLSRLGYSVHVDGDYGQDTRRAVERFQRDHKLVVDGWSGPMTTAMLRSALEALG